tara:strand:- start:815 stop:1906 length:1092 start_codon:yes stop_codon:yes gene_type:complete
MWFFKKKKKIQYCGQTKVHFKSLKNEIKHVLGICLRPQYSLFKIEKKLGEGSFGKVYKAIIKHNKNYINVAIKYMGQNTLDEMKKEFNYSLEMAKNNLGPKIYKVFFYKDYLGNYKGIIVMEYMSVDGLDILLSSLEVRQKKIIVYEMLSLIHKSAKIAIKNKGIFCFDIKPENFMVNISKRKVVKVRMIDFDSNFCYNQKNLKSIRNLRKYVKNSKNPLVRSISNEKEVFLILLLTMIGSLTLFWRILDALSDSKKRRRENKAVLTALLPHIQTLCRDRRLRMGISIILQEEIQILNLIMHYSVEFQIKDLMNPSKSEHKKRITKFLPNWRELSVKERSRDIIEIIIRDLCHWGRKHSTFYS